MGGTRYNIQHGLSLLVDDSDKEPRRVLLCVAEIGEFDLTPLLVEKYEDDEPEDSKSPA